MSNCIFNISLGRWHLQIIRDRPFVQILRNEYVARPWYRLTIHESPWTK